jgi:tetratricopeptide (TPR) repeat protein
LGQYYYEDSQYDFARRNFEAVVRMYPRHNLSQESKYGIGLILWVEGKYSEAVQTLERLLEVCDQQELKVKTILAIGDLQLEQGNQEKAIQRYNDLINMVCPGSANSTAPAKITEEGEPELRVSLMEYREKTQKETIVSGKASLKDNVNSSIIQYAKLAYIKLGDMYKNNDKFSEAIFAYSKALKFPSDESEAQIRFKLAESLEEAHNFEASLKAYSSISDIKKEDMVWVVKGLLRSARIYEDRGNWQEAIKRYEKIINYNVPEASYARDKIDQIRKQIKAN